MAIGGVHFLIAGVNDETDYSALAKLTNQAVLSVSKPIDNHKDWSVSRQVPELTQVFTGQTIIAKTTEPQLDYALQNGGENKVIPIITSKDASARD